MKITLIFLILLVSSFANSTTLSENTCLALVIYNEANAESKLGQRAVLDVVYNRMDDTGYTACQIIKAKNQFSWTKKRSKWKLTLPMLVRLELIENIRPVVDYRYKYFLNKHLSPYWIRHMHCRIIGNHKFCR